MDLKELLALCLPSCDEIEAQRKILIFKSFKKTLKAGAETLTCHLACLLLYRRISRSSVLFRCHPRLLR